MYISNPMPKELQCGELLGISGTSISNDLEINFNSDSSPYLLGFVDSSHSAHSAQASPFEQVRWRKCSRGVHTEFGFGNMPP